MHFNVYRVAIIFFFIKKAYYVVDNYIMHYNLKNTNVFSPYVKDVMSQSSVLLMVVSDDYLIHEWNNMHFRNHVRYLQSKENARLVMIQLHDVCDEEVEDYFRKQLQIPRLTALEQDEFMFWHKLYYYLYTFDKTKKSVMPVAYNAAPIDMSKQHRVHSSAGECLPPFDKSDSCDNTDQLINNLQLFAKAANEHDFKSENDHQSSVYLRDNFYRNDADSPDSLIGLDEPIRSVRIDMQMYEKGSRRNSIAYNNSYA